MLQFHALGGLAVTENGDAVSLGGQRQRRLVAMLLIHRNSVVSVDRLAEAVFAGEPTPGAATTLRSYVARVRKVVDGNGSGATLVTQAPGYLIRLPAESFDVACFERLLADARTKLTHDDAAGALCVTRDALDLWRGSAYAEFADEEWARPEARRLDELRLVAHECLIDAALACGRAVEMIPEVEALVEEQPLREAFRAQLVLALFRSGRQAEALRVVREYRHVLADELGLDPSPSLVELERRVLAHDPALLATAPAGGRLRGYRLGERLGTGRDGTLYAARLPDVERDFVVRVLRAEIADDPDFVRTFEARAHRLASLRHPAVVAIHDYWREPGAAYLVLRRMNGGALTDRLQRGPMTRTQAANLVGRVGGALTVAARAGIVHGRVTSDSVLFDAGGDPFLSDFSLAPSDQTASDDVHDLAVLVRRCLPAVDEAVAEVLARGVATVGRPSMGEFVDDLMSALAGADPVGQARPNPYQGLRAFDEADAGHFFGRAELIDEILARLGRDDLGGRLVLVVGGSGTGKSSAVRAGLLPRIRRGQVPGSAQWFVTTMLPGSSPFKELAESLRRVAVETSHSLEDELAHEGGIDSVIRRLVPDDGQLLLIVDQFEELFTLATDHDQRAFIDGMMHAVSTTDSRLRVVATLRADFYDRPLAVQPLAAAAYEATVTIPAMRPAELEAAIVEPVERIGGRVERALVAELVSAVVGQPAALPSLQFTLYELAERRPDKHLTLSAYRELGGVDGAIASRAEMLYTSLDDDDRVALQSMFERLVVVGANGEPTRRRVARRELSGRASAPSVDTAIDVWANARLLTLDHDPQTRVPTVELAHEALLHGWPRLRDWIESDRAALYTLSQLHEAAATWTEFDRDTGTLYRGVRLEAALDAVQGRADELPEVERQFLEASARQEKERTDRQARTNRRLRVQLSAVVAALVVALVGGFVAVDQRGDAQRERRVATARELAAASVANLADDPERSILLALAAIDETRSQDGTVLPEAMEALHRAVTTSRIVLSVPGVGGAVDWSPRGDVFVTEGPEQSGIVDLRDADTGESVRTFYGHDPDVNDVAFSADGSLLATTGDDGAARIWDPTTGEELSAVHGDGPVWNPSFSADGALLLAQWHESWPYVARLANVATGDVVSEYALPEGGGAELSPDGSRIVLDLRVVDARSGEELVALDGGYEWADPYAWSPDGRWIAAATVSPTGDVSQTQIWDATTGEQHLTLDSGNVVRLDWAPDGARLATASHDGTARIWEIGDASARERFRFSAQDLGSGGGVAFSPDGDRLLVGDADITAVKIFDVSIDGGREWANVPDGVPGRPGAASFTAEGRQLVTSSESEAAVFWDAESGDRARSLGASTPAVYLEASPDGRSLAGSTFDLLPVSLWDAETGERVASVLADSSGETVWALAWSPDGEYLAIIHGPWGERTVSIVDRAGMELATLRAREPGAAFMSVSFSSDGRLLATAQIGLQRSDPDIEHVSVWDWALGEVVRTIDTRADHVAFDPTEARLVSARFLDSLLDVWDPATGERLATLTGHTGVLRDVTFSRDGSRVATASEDGTARVWDPATGAQLHVLRDIAPVATVAFSPDGSMLASVNTDGIARVWALHIDDLIGIATDRLTRGLTDDECRTYLHVAQCPEPSPAG
jgi:WD40 repeat protein/DNA-binding SARP family transcriptional activator